MTLVNRVSTFFLAGLAIILACYSALLYGLTREHLYHQFDQDLQGSLSTLVAAVEVEDDDAKFEPSDHLLLSSGGSEADDVRWIVLDERNRVVDQSRNLQLATDSQAALAAMHRAVDAVDNEPLDLDDWRVLKQRRAAPHPKDEDERMAQEHAAITVIAARSQTELRRDLRQLLWLTTLLPLLIWLFAVIVGRRYTRRVLRPVQDMAERARSVTTADFDARLPTTSGDELAELGSTFNRLLDRLQEAYERQQRFTGDAAHQLRTPLTVLRGQIDVALRRERTTDEYRQSLVNLQAGATELEQIVESLLFLARSDQDAAGPELETIELHDWLATLAARWDHHPRAGDLRFDIEPGASCRASRPLLGQLLENLVDNALKYSQPGTPVVVQARTHDRQIVLTVEDQGIGIARDELDSMFKPFFRSPRVRQSGTPGTGLGLAVASRIATALGGRLMVASELHRGSRFTLTLERAAAGKPADHSLERTS